VHLRKGRDPLTKGYFDKLANEFLNKYEKNLNNKKYRYIQRNILR
jgi:hypothetical protein